MAKPEWKGASNVAPRRTVFPQPLEWRCPQCQVWVERWRPICDGCGTHRSCATAVR